MMIVIMKQNTDQIQPAYHLIKLQLL